MTQINEKYHNLLKLISSYGYEIKNDRTGIGTKKVFSEKIDLDVSEDNFPVITTKYIHWKSIVVELLWMLNGGRNTNYLRDHGVTIWDEWADEDGDLGPIYGHQWRRPFRQHWIDENGNICLRSFDQIQNLIDTIKNNPNDRRQLVNAWNVSDLPHMKLPPCHYAFQTFVAGDKLSLMVQQRSCDVFLGVPFNLSSYALLLVILAKLTGLEPYKLHWVGGDCHIYSNHTEQVEQQWKNYYNSSKMKNPKLKFDESVDFTSLSAFLSSVLEKPENIYLEGYEHMGKIKAPVAV